MWKLFPVTGSGSTTSIPMKQHGNLSRCISVRTPAAAKRSISWRRIPLVSYLVIAAARADGQVSQPQENKVMGYSDISFFRIESEF
jgi:hypothetical protein